MTLHETSSPESATVKGNRNMDKNTFDALTRTLAGATNRRSAVKGAAAVAAGLVGLRAVAGSVAAEDAVVVEGNRGPGKTCNKKQQCGHGLKCDDKGKCEYKGRNCGKKNHTCRKNTDCCGNLTCTSKRCVEKV